MEGETPRERKETMRKIVAMSLSVLFLLASVCVLAEGSLPATDREGTPLTLQHVPARVISLAPSTTQVMDDLGLIGRLVAVDTQSPLYTEGLSDLPQFDMMNPDCEAMAQLEPDLVLVTGMSYVDNDNPFDTLRQLGIQVAVIPSSDNLQSVADDVAFVANVLGEFDASEHLVSDMLGAIERVKAVGLSIPEAEKKRVTFEIGSLPYLYTFGHGTYLHEMIELIGAVNAFGEENSWISISEESAVAADPDVILTNVNYIPDPIGEIMNRAGWGGMKAIRSGQVYYIDNAASSLPNHHVADALVEMAKWVYPDQYADFAWPGDDAQ